MKLVCKHRNLVSKRCLPELSNEGKKAGEDTLQAGFAMSLQSSALQLNEQGACDLHAFGVP